MSSYRWMIVACGALMTCVGIGAMFSLAVYLQPMSVDTGWSRTGISSAMTIDFLVMGAAGFGWGALSDRIGPRAVTLAGACLLGLGLVLASGTTSLISFQLTYGVLVGLAAGAFFAPMIAAATGWFEPKRRSLAVSLVSAGMGVAPMTISPFARYLISTYDWRTAMMTIGIAAWVLLIPTALLVRRAPVERASGPARAVDEPKLSVGEALRSPQFIVLALTFFLCCGAHSGPIFHMVSYAIGCGIAPLAAVSIYSVEGLSGLGGRLLLGLLADRFGAKPVLISGLLVQSLCIAAYLFVNRLEAFYAIAVVFGTAYGGVMPLYAVLARESFGQRIMGTVFGAMTMVSAIGMAFGPWAGGRIFDANNSYAWLYLGASGVALAAVLVALVFSPRREERLLQPA
ncbi:MULTISPECIES: MFS transporter [unclassified Bradyrhizobium]|uniref:MFS transporter n=1 Tax=unclassified Bradyrhizobium TaxID=2631580 RepID=UPI002479D253|nr:MULTISPECIES: MFS transporter [unclassified Bradyrhizobium]WGR72327.1 MFS transporter [Bradyrhizobium sp. ISRA426]WGR77161.1 MFS transporter [Bradyrhizobium sp. ISRA430]WGR87566.1 MFS transporter [Bradyrhizobium sp. ISRA432]